MIGEVAMGKIGKEQQYSIVGKSEHVVAVGRRTGSMLIGSVRMALLLTG